MTFVGYPSIGFLVITDYLLQIIGVIDVNRTKEKGYTTVVKEGFCDEVKSRFLILFLTLVRHYNEFR